MFSKLLVMFAVVFAVGFLVSVVGAWPVMIMFSIFHTYWPQVPGFGFVQTLFILWGAAVVLSMFRGTLSNA